jgi:hypothetical protein
MAYGGNLTGGVTNWNHCRPAHSDWAQLTIGVAVVPLFEL